MIPERQKAHVYYRCHTRECPKNIVREDRLEQSVREALACVELSQDDAEQLSSDWQLWLRSKYFDDIRRSLDLRIAQTEKRLERLTDLLIDGAISPSVHHRRQHDMKLEIGQLKHDRAQLHSEQPSERHLANFLELMKSLVQLHISANRPEKRILVENCFSNRTVVENRPCLEPYSWLKCRDFAELSPLVTQNGPLLELLSNRKIFQQPEPPVPQWKKNLKHQISQDPNNFDPHGSANA